MANIKTDDSGVITTEFYTGRCPMRCEMCFVNFGEGGQSVPFAIYGDRQQRCFNYANCTGTLERLHDDRSDGTLDYVADLLCGPGGRNWGPVTGADSRTGEAVEFWAGMSKEDFKHILKPLTDDRGLYSIPKVPEAPWFRKIEYVEVFNGQTLPAVLRVNSMSDSSVAPPEWIRQVGDIWGEDCFFNTQVHAIKRYPRALEAGLFDRMVVTANPGLQSVHGGLNRYWTIFPNRAAVVEDPGVLDVARKVYGSELYLASDKAVADYIKTKLTLDEINGLITLRLAAGTMKGGHDRPWHFFKPIRVREIRSGYDALEQGHIKFYRVRALPTIQPDVSKFDDVPVVYTVLRFKTVQQACEWATKYGMDIECVVSSQKDAVVCQYYNVPYSMANADEETLIAIKSDDPLNASPRRGEWTELYFSGNFFRTSKKSMDDLQFVCDRAGVGCKGCGLCACLDGTREGWQNPKLAEFGLTPKTYAKQSGYVCDSKKMPIATHGIEGRGYRGKAYDVTMTKKQVRWAPEEYSYYKQTLADYGVGFRTEQAKLQWEKAKAAAARRRQAAGEPAEEKNPSTGTATPDLFQMAQTAVAEDMSTGRRRNPDDSLALALQAVVDYGTQGVDGPDDFWVQGWDTHEQASTTIAQVFWSLMCIAHDNGMTKEEAIDFACKFSEDAVGMNLFEFDMMDLSGMYDGTSYWTAQFGPTTP
jgi:hypothetical protein